MRITMKPFCLTTVGQILRKQLSMASEVLEDVAVAVAVDAVVDSFLNVAEGAQMESQLRMKWINPIPLVFVRRTHFQRGSKIGRRTVRESIKRQIYTGIWKGCTNASTRAGSSVWGNSWSGVWRTELPWGSGSSAIPVAFINHPLSNKVADKVFHKGPPQKRMKRSRDNALVQVSKLKEDTRVPTGGVEATELYLRHLAGQKPTQASKILDAPDKLSWACRSKCIPQAVWPSPSWLLQGDTERVTIETEAAYFSRLNLGFKTRHWSSVLRATPNDMHRLTPSAPYAGRCGIFCTHANGLWFSHARSRVMHIYITYVMVKATPGMWHRNSLPDYFWPFSTSYFQQTGKKLAWVHYINDHPTHNTRQNTIMHKLKYKPRLALASDRAYEWKYFRSH